MYCENTNFLFVDDKAITPAGEPENLVSTDTC